MNRRSETLFVGGPRHGKTVAGQPEKEGELYRVPATSAKDEPVDYKASEVTLTFPHPVTGVPGDTFTCFVYVIPALYPDNPQAQQMLQTALPEAALRSYIMTNGRSTTGGPEAVAAQREPVYVAWCEDDDCAIGGVNAATADGPWEVHTFPTLKERAVWIGAHKTATGHVARWEDRKKG